MQGEGTLAMEHEGTPAMEHEVTLTGMTSDAKPAPGVQGEATPAGMPSE
jgi:hypothetical protein